MPPNTVPSDDDLAEQAHPGHGVPSQDPASAAQFPLAAEEAEREAKSVWVGGGMVAGATTGAALGVVVGGPVGVVLGGAVGAVVGALGAGAAGSVMSPQGASKVGTTPADGARLHAEESAAGDRPTARVVKVIAASPSEIWAALTTPATLKPFFFGADVVTDWKVGSPIRMQAEFPGKACADQGEIVTFEPLRQLSFSHGSALSGQADTPANRHLVTFDLTPDGAATKVTLSQSRLMGEMTAADADHRADNEKNLSSVLDGLGKLALA